uniref:Envelope glycoprotein n=1 Tax=Acanthochromis polyacanthus TaxID=80966 RepID=A0A3Q1E9Q4_9TELE
MLTGQLSIIAQRPDRLQEAEPLPTPRSTSQPKRSRTQTRNKTRSRNRTPKRNRTQKRTRRSAELDGWDWKNSGEVYISWDQVPYGVPYEHAAIHPGWIEPGRVAGSAPMYGQAVNAQYVARNSRWVNLLWYNQQRFINYTIKGLSLVREQLHATSIMVLQNRFVIESLMAPHQGVCEEIGEECCTEIPLYTAADGNLTRVLNEMRRMRDEHVLNSNWNTQIRSFWDWLTKGGWLHTLKVIGIAIGVFCLMVMVVVCCIAPILRLMVSTVFKKISGQFPLVQVQNAEQVNTVSTHTTGGIYDGDP